MKLAETMILSLIVCGVALIGLAVIWMPRFKPNATSIQSDTVGITAPILVNPTVRLPPDSQGYIVTSPGALPLPQPDGPVTPDFIRGVCYAARSSKQMPHTERGELMIDVYIGDKIYHCPAQEDEK